MTVNQMTWAWEQDIPPKEKLVLLVCADNNLHNTPSIPHICIQTRMSERKVIVLVERLRAKGLLP